jgi:DNA-binding transcriptional LysR family regulator
MINITLRHLRYFVAVAEDLNFATAAKRLHISQPPLTRQIQLLEEQLGVQLFDRSTRRVELTSPGKIYLDEARSVLAQVEKGWALARHAAEGEIGSLIIGYEKVSVLDFLFLAIKEFKASFPKIDLVLKEMRSDEQEHALNERQISIGFILPPIKSNVLKTETIAREPMVAVLPEGHPLCERHELQLNDLANEFFVLSPMSNQCGLRHQVIEVCRTGGFNPKVAQETNDVQVLLGLVAAGMGVALLPEHFDHLKRPGIVFRRLPATTMIEFAMAWRQDDTSRPLQAFLDMIRKCAKLEESAVQFVKL